MCIIKLFKGNEAVNIVKTTSKKCTESQISKS